MCEALKKTMTGRNLKGEVMAEEKPVVSGRLGNVGVTTWKFAWCPLS